MIATVKEFAHVKGIVFDEAFLQSSGLKSGDQFEVSLGDNGLITLTPIPIKPSREDVSNVIRAKMKEYAQTMKSLA